MMYKIRNEPERRITRLQEIIDEVNMTQKHLAELADLEKYQVSKLCTGEQVDYLMSTAKKICNVLNLPLDAVFGD